MTVFQHPIRVSSHLLLSEFLFKVQRATWADLRATQPNLERNGIWRTPGVNMIDLPSHFLGSHCSLFFSRSIWEFLTMGNCSKSHKNPYGSHTKVNNINNLDELSGSLILRKPRTWIPSNLCSSVEPSWPSQFDRGFFNFRSSLMPKSLEYLKCQTSLLGLLGDVFVATRVGQVQQWTHKMVIFLMFSRQSQVRIQHVVGILHIHRGLFFADGASCELPWIRIRTSNRRTVTKCCSGIMDPTNGWFHPIQFIDIHLISY